MITQSYRTGDAEGPTDRIRGGEAATCLQNNMMGMYESCEHNTKPSARENGAYDQQ